MNAWENLGAKGEVQTAALLRSVRSILSERDFGQVARTILDGCKEITDARAGYLALLSAEGDGPQMRAANVVCMDGDPYARELTNDPQMRICGARGAACQAGKAVYTNDFVNSSWVTDPAGIIGGLERVLCVPLILGETVVGFLELANKVGPDGEANDFNDDDAAVATLFAELATISLQHSRATGSLEESEARLRGFVSACPAGIFLADQRGKVVEWNAAQTRLLGLPREQALGRFVWDLHEALLPDWHPERAGSEDKDSSELFREAVLEALAAGEVGARPAEAVVDTLQNHRHWVSLDDGTERLVRFPFFPVPRRGGEGGGYELGGIAWDVTDEVQAHGQVERLAGVLQRERDILRVVMDYANTNLVFLDPDFKIILVNSAYAKSAGSPRDALVGQDHFALFPSLGDRKAFKRVVETGQPEASRSVSLTLPAQPERGVTYWDWSAAPVPDERGGVQGLVLSLVDVTERERALKRREHDVAGLATLIAITEQVLAQRTVQDLLVHMVEAARRLTGARFGFAIHGHEGEPYLVVTSDREGVSARMREAPLAVVDAWHGQYSGDMPFSFLVAEDQLREYLSLWGLPQVPAKAHELLGARLVGHGGRTCSIIIVSGKEDVAVGEAPEVDLASAEGIFMPEDEALVAQLAALASLGLQQIEALEVAEQRAAVLDATFTSIAEAVVIYGPDGEIVGTNKAARTLLKLDEAGRSSEALWPARPNLVGSMPSGHAAGSLPLGRHAPQWEESRTDEWPVAQALRGETVPGVVARLDVPAEHEPRWLSISAAPVLSHATGVQGAVSVFTDVTELRNVQERLEAANVGLAEQALRLQHQTEELLARNEELRRLTHQLEEEQARLNAIIQNAPEGIVVTDEAYGIVLANPAAERLYVHPVPVDEGYDSHTGLNMLRLDGSSYAPLEHSLARAVREGQTQRNLELVIEWPDGQKRHLLANTAPIRTQRDRIAGAVGMFQDITARIEAEEALRNRNRELSLLNAVGRELSGTLALEEVLDRVLEAVRQIAPVDRAAVWLVDRDHPEWLVRTAVAPPGVSEGAEPERIRIGEGPSAVSDGSKSPTFTANLSLRGRTVGLLEVANSDGHAPSSHDQVMLTTLAAWAAIAIENALLHREARHAAVVAERTRLASELHDAVSQLLFSAKVTAESLLRLWETNPEAVRQGLGQLQELTQGALAEMRTLLLELRPAALVETDLGELLKQLTQAMASRGRIKVALRLDGTGRLPAETQIALYRIAQEALNNVVKHARAHEAEVVLDRMPDKVTLVVQDDGRGFDVSCVAVGCLGLKILHERATAIGAELAVDSSPGHGTRVRVEWRQGDPALSFEQGLEALRNGRAGVMSQHTGGEVRYGEDADPGDDCGRSRDGEERACGLPTGV